MMYLGGVTLGYFNLYPPGFQPKTEGARRETETAPGTATEGSRLSSSRRPIQWPLYLFF
jgi:hypothetical protein